MHYVDEGTGKVVLLLHGNPTWCFFYRNLIRELRQEYRVIAPDFLGCGFSDRTPGKRFRASDRIDQLDEFVSVLGINQFSIVMHDWGGPLGTGLILRRLENVEKVVYLNTTLTETESLPAFIKIAATPVIGKFLTRHTASFIRMATSWGVTRKLAPDVAEMYHLPYKTRPRRDAIWDFVADIPFDSNHPTYTMMMELAAGLPRVAQKPVKIIWGLKDLCFHREMLSKVAAHFPKAEIMELPGAAHLVLEDAPSVTIPAIREFLGRAPDVERVVKGNAEGEDPVINREDGTVNVIYDAVVRRAEQNPSMSAVVVPRWVRDPLQGSAIHYAHTTYGELVKIVNQYQRGLSELGLAPGDRVLMLVSPGSDFLALALAVMGRGATPVFVDPGIGLERMFRCIQDSDPHAFIGSPKAHLVRLLRRSLFHRIKFHITASEWALTGGHSLAYLKRFANAPLPAVPLPRLQTEGVSPKARDAALIAFTSGATGTPKGVIFTNEMLAAQVDAIRDALHQEAGTYDLTLLPIFSLYNVALGVSSVLPSLPVGKPLALEPAQIVKVIGDLRIQSSFGSPALWNKIAEYMVRSGGTLPTIRRIFMAGAAVPPATLDLVQRVAPHGTVSTPYGATEALPVTYITSSDVLSSAHARAVSGEQGTPVGRAVAGIEVRIIQLADEPARTIDEIKEVPRGTIGEIIVRGANISPEYLHRPDANRTGKIADDRTFWHRMGDIGYLDDVGNLYYCGRRTHSIFTHERAYHSVPIEDLYNVLPKVRRSALVGIKGGKEPGIVIEPLPQFWPENDEQREQFLRELRDLSDRDPLTQGIQQFFFHRSFPVDPRHNAKIFRDQLSQWADRMLADKRAA